MRKVPSGALSMSMHSAVCRLRKGWYQLHGGRGGVGEGGERVWVGQYTRLILEVQREQNSGSQWV